MERFEYEVLLQCHLLLVNELTGYGTQFGYGRDRFSPVEPIIRVVWFWLVQEMC